MRLLEDLSGFARLRPQAALADAMGLGAMVVLLALALG